MATFVFVSGAWHGGWCWERIVPLLEDAGHRAIAPDLIGMGDDATPVAGVTLADWAGQIAGLVRAQADPVILVGHSRGGIIISEVAEHVPERIATLVYLAAFLLPAGETLLGAAGRVPPYGPNILSFADDGTTTVFPEAVAERFYNMTPPEWQARARDRVRPEPSAPLKTPITVSDARFGCVPRAYIECLRDRAVPIALQRMMQGDWPCDPVFTMDCDHSPFFSEPDALVRHLLALARR